MALYIVQADNGYRFNNLTSDPLAGLWFQASKQCREHDAIFPLFQYVNHAGSLQRQNAL